MKICVPTHPHTLSLERIRRRNRERIRLLYLRSAEQDSDHVRAVHFRKMRRLEMMETALTAKLPWSASLAGRQQPARKPAVKNTSHSDEQHDPSLYDDDSEDFLYAGTETRMGYGYEDSGDEVVDEAAEVVSKTKVGDEAAGVVSKTNMAGEVADEAAGVAISVVSDIIDLTNDSDDDCELDTPPMPTVTKPAPEKRKQKTLKFVPYVPTLPTVVIGY